MAAGLGFKTFTTGEVLTSADTNGYLMQGVLVFASSAARDAAITSPQEGQFAYLKDTNVTTYYTGSAWANLDTTGMTNPMTTTGDTIYSSSGSTPARLGIGSTGNVLTVAGGVPTWAAPAGGGGKSYSLLNAGGTSLTGATTITISGISGMENFLIQVNGASASANSTFYLRINGSSTGGLYLFSGQQIINGTSYSTDTFGVTYTTGTDGIYLAQQSSAAGSQISAGIQVDGGTSTGYKSVSALTGANLDGGSGSRMVLSNGIYKGSAAITSISLFSDNGNFDGGTIYVYASA